MNQIAAKEYQLVKRIKDDKFDVDELHKYSLALQIGTRDFQLCVIDGNKKVLLLEDFKLEGVKTINSRIRILQELFDEHHLLKAGFWKNVKLCFKTHKYTLIPNELFIPQSAVDYLALNSELKPTIESANYYKHEKSGSVNVFASDRRLIDWIKEVYPAKQIGIIHQDSALIHGISEISDGLSEKAIFSLIDRGIMHLVVFDKTKLIYSNQFAAQRSEDLLKYLMLVFKELKLNQKATKLTIWGILKQNSKHVEFLRKYIRNISFGGRPKALTFSYHFDEISEHQYFDLFNIPLCD